jgi:hypothetical protein
MKAVTTASLLLGLLLSSCVITRSPGFYSGYDRLPPKEQAKIRFVSANQPIPEGNDQIIYAVNARSLLHTLSSRDTTLVYIWGPHCHSAYCASLQSVQDLCHRKGYQFQAVAEYYADMQQINGQPRLQNPLVAINQRSYKTDYCDKYTALFESELRQGQPLPDSVRHARYYIFKGSTFVRAQNALAEVTPQFPSYTPQPLSKLDKGRH